MPSRRSTSRSSRSKSRSAAPPEPRVEQRKRSLALLLHAANHRMEQLFDLELAADGVEANGYAALSVIGVRESLNLTDIAEELGMPLTTASDLVRRLERRGHVRRRQNPDDGRSFLFELTAAGDREWRRGWGAIQRILGGLREELDEELVRQMLVDLNEAFEQAIKTR